VCGTYRQRGIHNENDNTTSTSLKTNNNTHNTHAAKGMLGNKSETRDLKHTSFKRMDAYHKDNFGILICFK
jgi:hypothetical protein